MYRRQKRSKIPSTWFLIFILALIVAAWIVLISQVLHLRLVREWLLDRPSRMGPAQSKKLAVLCILRDEALNLREWLQHYVWQGVDLFLLLDNGSTDGLDAIAADFPSVTVLRAPEMRVQVLHYGELGRPWLEERGIQYVAVLDVDEFFFAEEPGATFRDAAVLALQNASQFTCAFHHFGSSGFDKQPYSVRECFTMRSAVTSAVDYGKSVVRLQDLRHFSIHQHVVSGATVQCPPGLLNFHYKTQSREYWETVKLRRGDVNKAGNEGAYSWAVFDADDRTGNATKDTRLRDRLRSEGLAQRTRFCG